MGVQGMKDPFNRGCMPWVHQDRDLLHWYQRLGQMRRGCKALAAGTFVPVQGDLGGVCYERQSDGAGLLAAVNRTAEPKTFAVDPVWDNAYAFFDDTWHGRPVNRSSHVSCFAYQTIKPWPLGFAGGFCCFCRKCLYYI